ncbi:hypothetical protein SAY87_024214 [Trapa incisa]|uniref:Uncharacterized protein n=2 Tax=Trapa TaxID=22665 RepID=A0AAN7R5J9_TRANT|nr:hypothetical protein SAY87_024214 [Trapa incisa]KAK4789110.1 hypothetical protein SAY86_020429 [Trapa natans]
MGFSKDVLDLVLSPAGLFIMFAYQLYFLYRYRRFPKTTVLGMENEDRKAWVESILQVQLSDRTVGASIISSNITASTFLSSVCLTLCSLVGAWFPYSSSNLIQGIVIYGNMSQSASYIKLICLLVCFLIAFSCFLESARHYLRASFLVTTSGSSPEEIYYTKSVLIRGGEYWFAGLRALYFALNFLLWFFGPIPMFAGSIILKSSRVADRVLMINLKDHPHERETKMLSSLKLNSIAAADFLSSSWLAKLI